MEKIAAMGDLDSICGYAFLGVEIFPFSKEEFRDAEKLLRNLCSEGYAIVYITEQLYMDILECANKISNENTIAIIPIPGINGNTNIGINNIKTAVKQAVGTDIIFDK